MEQRGGRLIQLLSSNRWGGVEQQALDISSSLIQEGWSVTVYTPDARAVDSRFEEKGISLRHAPMRGYLHFSSVSILARDFKNELPGAVVHVHRYRDALTALAARRLARRKDIKVVATRHCVRRGRDNMLFRRIYRNLHANIFVSELARDRFLSSWKEGRRPFDEGRLRVIHDSVREVGEEPSLLREKGPRTALFVGPVVPGKGIESIIDALVQLKGKKVRLKIAGGGDPDYIDSLRNRAQIRGVMEMIDWHGAERGDKLYEECHFGVQPSVKPEACGLANIICMAHGRTVVTTGNGAQPEYITPGEDGLFVPPADAMSLAQAINLLVENPGLLREMSEKAYKKFKDKLSWPIFLSRLLEAYR